MAGDVDTTHHDTRPGSPPAEPDWVEILADEEDRPSLREELEDLSPMREREPPPAEVEAAEIRAAAFLLDDEEGGVPDPDERWTDGTPIEPYPVDLDYAKELTPAKRELLFNLVHERTGIDWRPALSWEHRRRVEAAARAARSDRTTVTYAVQWRLFEAWAAGEGLEPLPAQPATVASYLAWRAEQGASVSTVRVSSAAISAAHRDQGLEDPTQHEGVKRTVAGVSRQQAGRQKRQARALTSDALAAIRATARQQRTWADGKRKESPERAETRGSLDIALCAVLRDALLRRSEAAALTWADIEAEPDGSGRLTVRRSKTDQEGGGAVLYLSPQTMQDLERIRPSPADPEASVFGLGADRIAGRVRAAAHAAGLEDADLYSGHSGRVGMAQDLVKDGASLPELMQAGRWESPAMPAHYARAELAAQGAVARYYNKNTRSPGNT